VCITLLRYTVILPWKFGILKFGGKNWGSRDQIDDSRTWPSLGSFSCIFWFSGKISISMSYPNLCRNFGIGRSPLMGHYRPYFCFSKKSIFLVVRWVNKWAWPNNKQTNKRESEAAQTDDIVTSWTVCDVGLIDNGPAPVSLTMWKRGSSSTSNNVTSIMLQDMFIS